MGLIYDYPKVVGLIKVYKTKGVETMETLTKEQIEKRIEKVYAEAFQLQFKGKKFTDKIKELASLQNRHEAMVGA